MKCPPRNPSGILTFPEDHPGLDDRSLDYCRRCPTSIVEAANNLIRRNHLIVPGRRLEPMEGKPPGTIYHVQWRSLTNEVDGLARYIRQRVNGDGIEPGKILVPLLNPEWVTLV